MHASTRSSAQTIAAVSVSPQTALALLSQQEVAALCERRTAGLNELFRRCALAVLSSGSENDDARALLERYRDFDFQLESVDRGLRLHLTNAPATAFVDGRMIRGVQQHLFSVLRDIVYVTQELKQGAEFDLSSSEGITDAVFKILRRAELLVPNGRRGLAGWWGGHSISRVEYDYTKEIGYALGLRGLDICTGCGPGAMKGPMKGATIAHAKQRIRDGRYIGISEPGIIAAEAPNPIVNALVIMPDMEKHLEAFVRVGHRVLVLPGGVGTVEEILYLLGILAHPDNQGLPYPVIMTGPRASADYFAALDQFIKLAMHDAGDPRYRIILGDAHGAARALYAGIESTRRYRDDHDDPVHFNWLLKIDHAYQQPFAVTHEAVQGLAISRDLPPHVLAANLRRVFSALVTGNVKEEGIRVVEAQGPFQINGDAEIMRALDDLLSGFVAQQRMRLPGAAYNPCYEVVR